MIYTKKVAQICCATVLLVSLSSCTLFKSSEEQDQAAPAHSKTSPAKSLVKEIETEQEFLDLLASGKPVIAKFYATWCGPCKRMKPIFADVSANYGDQAYFVSLDNDNKKLAGLFDQYGVSGFPTFIYFDAQGKVSDSRPGGMSQDEFDAVVGDFVKKQS